MLSDLSLPIWTLLEFHNSEKNEESAAVGKYKTGNQKAWVLVARLSWTL